LNALNSGGRKHQGTKALRTDWGWKDKEAAEIQYGGLANVIRCRPPFVEKAKAIAVEAIIRISIFVFRIFW